MLPLIAMANISNPVSDPRFEEAREKVTAWLREEGFAASAGPAEEGIAWSIRAEMKGQPVVGVSQSLDDAERVAVVVTLGFQPDDPANRLNPTHAIPLVWDLRFLLLALNLDSFSGIDFPFSTVQIAHICYRETLTRQEFGRALRKVRQGCNAILWTIYKRIGQQPPLNGGTIH